mmetsp:Transcript_22271/g.52429  ORF Transcript_22271/g.52429 Transcript_22271/m.52429 type:complete len:231 (+) Transcript_22271:782-1474(+)
MLVETQFRNRILVVDVSLIVIIVAVFTVLIVNSSRGQYIQVVRVNVNIRIKLSVVSSMPTSIVDIMSLVSLTVLTDLLHPFLHDTDTLQFLRRNKQCSRWWWMLLLFLLLLLLQCLLFLFLLWGTTVSVKSSFKIFRLVFYDVFVVFQRLHVVLVIVLLLEFDVCISSSSIIGRRSFRMRSGLLLIFYILFIGVVVPLIIIIILLPICIDRINNIQSSPRGCLVVVIQIG